MKTQPLESHPQPLTHFSQLVSLCKRRGFVFPSSEIYGGINACWDYGPLGVELKRNLKNLWWDTLLDREDMEGLDTAILMHPEVWKASGHVDTFTDPLMDCKQCKNRFRSDQLLELNRAQRRCPECRGELTEPRQFNLMFKTHMGAVENESTLVYLRPETAQGIYINFLNVQQSSRQKIPFGIAQIGKAFRNEITPGNFIFRTREFEQMEMQFFIRPETDSQWFEYWKNLRMDWYVKWGLSPARLRFHPHKPDQLAHYAKSAVDIEYEFPFGWQELEGIHNRGQFDLTQHQKFSSKKLEYFDETLQTHYLPAVIEASSGCDRGCLAFLSEAYSFENDRVWLRLHPKLAPYKAAILPLLKKPELMEYTQKVYQDLKKLFRVTTDDSGSIGKRYRRQDEIGTPFGITIDYDTLIQHTVTVRYRDTMHQERIPTDKLTSFLNENIHLGL